MSELRFRIPGLACGHCADAVVAAIGVLADVRRVQVDLDTKWVVVHADHPDVAAVRAAVDQVGHPPQL